MKLIKIELRIENNREEGEKEREGKNNRVCIILFKCVFTLYNMLY
jgi:hypothetical protein